MASTSALSTNSNSSPTAPSEFPPYKPNTKPMPTVMHTEHNIHILQANLFLDTEAKKLYKRVEKNPLPSQGQVWKALQTLRNELAQFLVKKDSPTLQRLDEQMKTFEDTFTNAKSTSKNVTKSKAQAIQKLLVDYFWFEHVLAEYEDGGPFLDLSFLVGIECSRQDAATLLMQTPNPDASQTPRGPPSTAAPLTTTTAGPTTAAATPMATEEEAEEEEDDEMPLAALVTPAPKPPSLPRIPKHKGAPAAQQLSNTPGRTDQPPPTVQQPSTAPGRIGQPLPTPEQLLQTHLVGPQRLRSCGRCPGPAKCIGSNHKGCQRGCREHHVAGPIPEGDDHHDHCPEDCKVDHTKPGMRDVTNQPVLENLWDFLEKLAAEEAEEKQKAEEEVLQQERILAEIERLKARKSAAPPRKLPEPAATPPRVARGGTTEFPSSEPVLREQLKMSPVGNQGPLFSPPPQGGQPTAMIIDVIDLNAKAPHRLQLPSPIPPIFKIPQADLQEFVEVNGAAMRARYLSNSSGNMQRNEWLKTLASIDFTLISGNTSASLAGRDAETLKLAQAFNTDLTYPITGDEVDFNSIVYVHTFYVTVAVDTQRKNPAMADVARLATQGKILSWHQFWAASEVLDGRSASDSKLNMQVRRGTFKRQRTETWAHFYARFMTMMDIWGLPEADRFDQLVQSITDHPCHDHLDTHRQYLRSLGLWSMEHIRTFLSDADPGIMRAIERAAPPPATAAPTQDNRQRHGTMGFFRVADQDQTGGRPRSRSRSDGGQRQQQRGGQRSRSPAPRQGPIAPCIVCRTHHSGLWNQCLKRQPEATPLGQRYPFNKKLCMACGWNSWHETPQCQVLKLIFPAVAANVKTNSTSEQVVSTVALGAAFDTAEKKYAEIQRLFATAPPNPGKPTSTFVAPVASLTPLPRPHRRRKKPPRAAIGLGEVTVATASFNAPERAPRHKFQRTQRFRRKAAVEELVCGGIPMEHMTYPLMQSGAWESLLFEIARMDDYEDAVALTDCLLMQKPEALALAATLEEPIATGTGATVAAEAATAIAAATADTTGAAMAATAQASTGTAETKEDTRSGTPALEHCSLGYGHCLSCVSTATSERRKAAEAAVEDTYGRAIVDELKTICIEDIKNDLKLSASSVPVTPPRVYSCRRPTEKEAWGAEKWRRENRIQGANEKWKTWVECQQLVNASSCAPSCPCMCEFSTGRRREYLEARAAAERARPRQTAMLNPHGLIDNKPTHDPEYLTQGCPEHNVIWQHLFKRAAERGWRISLEAYVEWSEATGGNPGPHLPALPAGSTDSSAAAVPSSSESISGATHAILPPEVVANATGVAANRFCHLHGSTSHSTCDCRAMRQFRSHFVNGDAASEEGILKLYNRVHPPTSRKGKENLNKQWGLSARNKFLRLKRWKQRLLDIARVEWWKPVYPGTIDEEGRDELVSGKRMSSSGNRGDCMRPRRYPTKIVI